MVSCNDQFERRVDIAQQLDYAVIFRYLLLLCEVPTMDGHVCTLRGLRAWRKIGSMGIQDDEESCFNIREPRCFLYGVPDASDEVTVNG